MVTLVDNVTFVLTNQVHELDRTGEAGGKEKKRTGRARGTKTTVADGHTTGQRRPWPSWPPVKFLPWLKVFGHAGGCCLAN